MDIQYSINLFAKYAIDAGVIAFVVWLFLEIWRNA